MRKDTNKLTPHQIRLADSKTVEAIEPIGVIPNRQRLNGGHLLPTNTNLGREPVIERNFLLGIGLKAIF